MPVETLPCDPAEDLCDPVEQADLLAEAFATGDQKYIAIALGAVARGAGHVWHCRNIGHYPPSALQGIERDKRSTAIHLIGRCDGARVPVSASTPRKQITPVVSDVVITRRSV